MNSSSDLFCLCSDCSKGRLCGPAEMCYAYREHHSSSINYGCYSSKQHAMMMCQESQKLTVKCCSDISFCNRNLSLPQIAPNSYSVSNFYPALFSILGVVAVLILIPVFFAIFCYFTRRKARKRDLSLVNIEFENTSKYVTQTSDSTLVDLFGHSCTSGSGSGLPFLVQRTIARQITLVSVIGKGRFGEVWRASWQGEPVAVKVFSSRNDSSWKREIQIYNTVLLRHENVLGFVAADMLSWNSCTQLWLVTHYHEKGSLADYLQNNILNEEALFKFAISIISGLIYLHVEILGTQGKPSIAHRDLKSKNILVKNDLSCCLADFGLAVTFSQTSNTIDFGSTDVDKMHSSFYKVGTKRYMAPEILGDSFHWNCFESFKRLDVYAFALVLWEICRRFVHLGRVDDYEQPYFDSVSCDPTFDEMKQIVVAEKRRPTIPNTWSQDRILCNLSFVIKECWFENPSARLTASRIKKTIQKIANAISNSSSSSV